MSSQAIEDVEHDKSSFGSEEETVTGEEDSSEKDEPVNPMRHTGNESNSDNVKETKLTDKKRIKLENPLSGQQRDQVVVGLARE